MFWVVLGLGFILTILYITLSNSKRQNRYTILIALLMVTSTLLLGLATSWLEKMIVRTDNLLGIDNGVSNSATDGTTTYAEDTPEDTSENDATTTTTESSNSSNNNVLELIAYEKNGKWGYVDSTGKMMIPFIYDTALDFEEGLAAVRIDYSWGFIDQNGKTVIPFEYDGAWSFIDGLAPVYKDNLWGFVNHNNEIVINFQYRNISKMNGAYFDENGNEISY